ncbi:MAG: MFS transporter, partial [Bacteroidota bacterium]
ILMPVIGTLMSKGVKPIPFVVAGFLLFAGYAWYSSKVSMDVSRQDFFFPFALRAVGMSMVQLPLINQAVAGLMPKDYASGIALNNMTRQLGGAFGIAMANNYVSHTFAQHRTDLVSNLVQGSAAFTERTNNIAQNFIRNGGVDVGTATTKAYGMISNAVDRQAYYLAYLDTFRLVALFFIVVIPLVVFLRVKKTAPVDRAAAKAAIAEAH